MDVFSTFPNAVVSQVWEIGTVEKATEVGDVFSPLGCLDVIIDEGASTQTAMSPNADQIDSGSLLYVRPEQVPTMNRAALMAGYLLRNKEEDQFYEIRDAGVGRNQETGKTEHIELEVRQTEAQYAEN